LCGAVLLLNVQSREEFLRMEPKPDAIGTVNITIRCDVLVGKEDSEHIPDDGVILPMTTVELAPGETVYDITLQTAKAYGIQLENSGGAAEDLVYLRAINHLYELQFGDLSGWIYRVNGKEMGVGCGACELADGDEIQWLYTCELGNDLQ